MNTKRLITASIFALVSASAVQAADVVVSHQPAPAPAPAVVAPTFAWTGFYFGGQVGGFSSKIDMSIIGKDETIPLSKDLSPKLSGFVGGLYAGSNIDLGDGFVLGVDTDLIWSRKKHAKAIVIDTPDNALVENLVARSRRSAPAARPAPEVRSAPEVAKQVPQVNGGGVVGGNHHGAPGGVHGHPKGVPNIAGRDAKAMQAADEKGNSVYSIEQVRSVISDLGLAQGVEVEALSHTLKQNWTGATRMRIGFAADRFMPYVAGGIAYAQLQDTVSTSFKQENGREAATKNLTDETKTMIGYTLGGGIDFAMLDNVIVRAEYRYADFGKKKFAKEKFEIRYKTNDFRVGVAYKF
ncbi:outer membrane protein [Bartonella sp. B12(2025)]